MFYKKYNILFNDILCTKPQHILQHDATILTLFKSYNRKLIMTLSDMSSVEQSKLLGHL